MSVFTPSNHNKLTDCYISKHYNIHSQYNIFEEN